MDTDPSVQPRASGVAPNAGQPGKVHRPRGENTGVLVDDGARQPVQVFGPTVVAEAVPRFPHRAWSRSRERLDRWVPLKEAGVVRLHPGNLRLLEHDFRHQHAVRIARAAPGQIPAMAAEPADQPTAKLRVTSVTRGGLAGHVG